MTNVHSNKKGRPILLISLLLVAIIQFGLLSYAYKDKMTNMLVSTTSQAQSDSQFKEVVNVSTLHKGEFSGAFNCYGKVRALRYVVLKCPSIPQLQTLTVKKICFQVGKPVKEGDVMVVFDKTQLNFKIELAQKQVEECKEKLDRANQAKDGVSVMNRNLAKIEYEKAITERDALLNAAKALTVTAPTSGYPGLCKVVENEDVEANKPICDLVDKSVFLVDLYVDPECERVLHNEFDPNVIITTISPNPENFNAVIEGVEQSIDPNTGKIRVVARITPSRNIVNLKHGVNVQAKIEKPLIEDVIVTHKKVLFEEFGNYFVCCVIFGNNCRETRIVKVDLIDTYGEICAIDSPELSDGSLVINEGIIKRDGVPVVIDEIID